MTLKEFIEKHIFGNGRFNVHAVRQEDWFEKRGFSKFKEMIYEETSFLPQDSPMRERIYCIRNDIKERQTCGIEGCNNPLKYHNGTYPKACSNECWMKSKERKIKNKESSQKKYGVDNNSKSSIVRAKIKKSLSESSSFKEAALSNAHKRSINQFIKKCNKQEIDVISSGPDILTGDRILKCRVCKETFTLNDYPFLSQRFRCPFCVPKRDSNIEKMICLILDKHQIPYLRNDRKLFGTEIDIVIPSHKLGIEIDGVLWHSFGKSKYYYLNNYKQENKNKHLEKTELVNKQGYDLLHFIDFEIQNKKSFHIVESMILNKLGISQKIYARKCSAKFISTEQHREFLEENHLHGKVNASQKIGLFYGDELVQVISLGKDRYGKKCDWELYRLCTKKGFVVVGGFSKLISFAKKNGITGVVKSFVDRRFSNGCGFEKVGFEQIRCSPPNYFYWLHEGRPKIVKRYSAQKHKLPILLGENFDPDKTETENMYDCGYRKFYDCGNFVYQMEW